MERLLVTNVNWLAWLTAVAGWFSGDFTWPNSTQVTGGCM
jgi:hypothetical protein